MNFTNDGYNYMTISQRRYNELVKAEQQAFEARQQRDRYAGEANDRLKKIADVQEENGELRDLLKQAIAEIGSIGPVSPGGSRSRRYRLGARPDLRITINSSFGLASGEARTVRVTRAPSEAPKLSPRQELAESIVKHGSPFFTRDTAEELLRDLERKGVKVVA